MAVLTNSERLNIVKQFGADLSFARTAFSLSKPDLRAAVNAIDDWVDGVHHGELHGRPHGTAAEVRSR